MFASRERRQDADVSVEVAFTDRWGGVTRGPYATLDLTRRRDGSDDQLTHNRALLARAFGVEGFVHMRQVHGGEVVVARSLDEDVPTCDALVTDVPDVALCVRVGDCAPVVLADVHAGVAGVAHVGRPGVTAGVVQSTVEAMRDLGARRIEAWIGPHVCGGCYEVPAAMRADVARIEPAAFCCTRWGSPSVDIGAAAAAQLLRFGCVSVASKGHCTVESSDFFSYRRQGPDSGRQAGLVVVRNDRPAGGST